MKREVKNGLLNVLERTVRMDIQKAEKNGPPICPLILHQPKRPKK